MARVSQNSRYLNIGPGGRHCNCCFPAPRSKDRRAQFRRAKRRAEREALKQAEADMIDDWASMNEWLQQMEAEDQYWSDYDNGVEYDTDMSDYDDDDYYYDNYYYDDDWPSRMYSRVIYPDGAIRSIDELRSWSWVWVASKEFRVCYDRKHSGDITLSEMLDYNIIKLNGYNDWFIFANKQDAEVWAQTRNGQ